MQRVLTDRPWPLFDVGAIRRIEAAAAQALPPHALMQRAGLAVARLALAVAPHARTIWIACGPGNNGGDGFEAAARLAAWGKHPVVTWLGTADRAPADARASLERARSAGVAFAEEPPGQWDLAIDALLGIGTARPLEGALRAHADRLNAGPSPVLAVDVPSGLDADTGSGPALRARWTLSLLALKPGLFTAGGRDAAGEVWFDDLGVPSVAEPPVARLNATPPLVARPHASHKGSYGDVAVIGGAPGMTGAALLAGSAALHAGAGRVHVSLLEGGALAVDPAQPDLMFRPAESLDLSSMAVACGCGGGEAVRPLLPKVLASARHLVLDADALNAIAGDVHLQDLVRARAADPGRATVVTPHPLEAARLLGQRSGAVQADRLAAARALSEKFAAVVVLKGSGTVITAPGELPVVNSTGNGRLATAGTGDVLAGMIAAGLAQGVPGFVAACAAVHAHGAAADHWPAAQALTASELARRA